MIKNLLKATLSTILVIFILGSCAKKTDPPASTTPTPALSASINGTVWTAATITGQINSGVVMISGSIASTGSSISLIINSSAPGTYTVGNSNNAMTYTKNGGINYLTASGDGTIVVTSFSDNYIKGTFKGTCTNTMSPTDKAVITSGTFTAKLQ